LAHGEACNQLYVLPELSHSLYGQVEFSRIYYINIITDKPIALDKNRQVSQNKILLALSMQL
jgi:hypothetical protein